VTESLTTSCAYDHLWVGCRLEFATYSLFWLGMASNSKTGGGDPVSVRLWPSAPCFQARKSPSDRNLGASSLAKLPNVVQTSQDTSFNCVSICSPPQWPTRPAYWYEVL